MKYKHILNIHKKLYHMANENAWENISKHGLCSTEALLNIFEIKDPLRKQLLTQHRPECVTIKHPEYGTAIVRDQKPLRETTLKRVLDDGLSPSEWYQILNRKTFFWTTHSRLCGLLAAKAYRNYRHCVLTLDAKKLIERHYDAITLSPYNSGCTLFNAPRRGNSTFSKIDDFDYDYWRNRGRKADDVIVELAVDYRVTDILDFIDSVDMMQSDSLPHNIYRRST
ncbi:hypothetical protein [Nitratidesulfovibrio sp.]|uniref:DUF7002 family protein n=1 Tax=Nitratidesulfovibrio sp. TaxID=2802297 RepID=UPI00333F658B